MPQLCRRTLLNRLMILNSGEIKTKKHDIKALSCLFGLDARFNKALIDGCESDIHKHCQQEFVNTENDDDEQDGHKEDDDDEDGIVIEIHPLI